MNTVATFFASIITLFSGLFGYTSPPITTQQPVSKVVTISETESSTDTQSNSSTTTNTLITSTTTTKSSKIAEKNVPTSSSSQSDEAVIWSDEKNKYTSNNGNIYINSVQIEDADQKSFQIINQNPFPHGKYSGEDIVHYSKDKNRVYYNEKVIPGAEITSFVVVWPDAIVSEQVYARDINNVYYNGEVLVPKANVASFNPLGALDNCWRVGGNYSMDKSRIYYKNTEVAGADVSTFNSEYEGQYATDKSHVFYEGKIVLNADPTTFKFPMCDGEG